MPMCLHRKHISKSKTVPSSEVSKQLERSSRAQCASVDSYSLDSGEGTFDHQDYCDGGTSDFSEISIPVPSFRSSSSSSMEISLRQSPTNQTSSSSTNIPIIMTSMYDSTENLFKPVENVEPKPSTR